MVLGIWFISPDCFQNKFCYQHSSETPGLHGGGLPLAPLDRSIDSLFLPAHY